MDTNLTSSIFHRQLIGNSVIKNWKTETLVQRLKLTKTFNCHNGCVNTIQFDTTGNLMISGSDDKTLKILDPKLKSSNKSPTLWSYQTNHFSNIFSASLVNGLVVIYNIMEKYFTLNYFSLFTAISVLINFIL